MSIFVGNLPFRAEREDVLQLFAPFGEVLNCSLPLERDTGRKRGFAFVEMGSPSEAKEAVRAFDGTRMCGFNVKVKMSNGGKEGTMVQGRDGYWGIGKTDEESRVRRSKERGRRRSIDRSSSSESDSTDERLSSSKNKSKSYKSKRLHRKRRSRSRSRS